MKHSERSVKVNIIMKFFEMPLAEVTEVSPRHEVIPNGQPRAEACSQRGDHIVTWKILQSGTAQTCNSLNQGIRFPRFRFPFSSL